MAKLTDILKGHHEWTGEDYKQKPYVHQEYPKFVDGILVKTEDEHRAMRASGTTSPDSVTAKAHVAPQKPKNAAKKAKKQANKPEESAEPTQTTASE